MLGFGPKKAKEAPAEELAPVAPIIPAEPEELVEETPAPDTIPAPAPQTEAVPEASAYVPRDRRVAPQE